jgi:hypothetical protein
MFGRRDLKKNGVRAQAIVRAAAMTGSTNSHGAFDIAAGFGRGESVPVLCDPDDRSKVEVDEDGLKAASEERVAALQASATRLEGEMRARGDTPPGR